MTKGNYKVRRRSVLQLHDVTPGFVKINGLFQKVRWEQTYAQTHISFLGMEWDRNSAAGVNPLNKHVYMCTNI
jgi:hypothetical protein